MDKYTMVVAIIFIVMTASVLNSRSRKKGKNDTDSAPKPDVATTTKIANLEERVAVLERIVTDKKTRLKDEIDAL